MTGKVKCYNVDKAYGFIIADDPEVETDIFFHITQLSDRDHTPQRGDVMSFDLSQEPTGFRAKNVKREGIQKGKSTRDVKPKRFPSPVGW